MTSVFNVSFGKLSYSPLPCTNNLNISTKCSSGERRVIDLALAALTFTLFLVLT